MVEQKKEQRSSKTPQVMRLVDNTGDNFNPIIAAGKSHIPKKNRHNAPLSKIMKAMYSESENKRLYDDLRQNEIGRDMYVHDGELMMYTVGEDKISVNIISVLLAEMVPEVLERFNFCDCALCRERLSEIALDELPAKFVRIHKNKSEKEKDAELQKHKKGSRQSVARALVKHIMPNKKRHFHDE